jgi:hypothetical protein
MSPNILASVGLPYREVHVVILIGASKNKQKEKPSAKRRDAGRATPETPVRFAIED